MASLLVTDGPLAGRRLRVEARLVLGRLDADVAIDDPLISRRHAEIRPVRGSLEIEDQGSLNGTWVNGERITGSRPIAPGDVVRIGSTVIEVERDPVEEGGAIPAPASGRHSRFVSMMPPAEEPRPPEPAGPQARPAPIAEPVEPAPRPAPPAPVPEVEAARPRPAPPPPVPEAETPAPRPLDRPAADEAAAAPRREDELRPVTALFADIVGSTGLGEKLEPDEVKVLVGECVSRMSRAVEQFGGVVQAYMGDGIASFFGVPSAHEDDPERAGRAALRILEELRVYAQEVEAVWGISGFNARVGINTGEAAVGLVGAADPQSVSLGDMANVAARLQAAADPGSIVVGDRTAESLLHKFALEPLGEVSLKGRQQRVGAWKLVGSQTALRAAPTTPLVGRDQEVARLGQAVDELTAGRGQIVVLLGDTGIGKTRVLGELRLLAAERVAWLEGHCLSYGTGLLYAPFIEMLRGWIGAEEGEPELAVRTKLRVKLSLLPESRAAELLPYLARLLSIRVDPAAEERLNELPPTDLAAEIRRAYQGWVELLAGQGPVVVAIEDLHWADGSTCELTSTLLELAERAPLLLVSTLRVDTACAGWQLRVHALSEHPHRAVELPLEPLTDAGSRQLLAALPRADKLSASELDQIVAGAEGNPLYLEELLNAFTDGIGPRGGLTSAPTTTGTGMLTPTLESLLLARIDRLPESARRLAQLAAVVGRSFPLRVLEHTADTDDLDRDLAALLRADVIRELRRYPEREYVFRHGLLREACLSTLPPSRRRELYGAVGTAFESRFATTAKDHLEVLANYFARSDDLGRALAYLERAGKRAATLDQQESAARLWRRALKVAEKLGDEEAVARVQEQLAAAGAGSSPKAEAEQGSSPTA